MKSKNVYISCYTSSFAMFTFEFKSSFLQYDPYHDELNDDLFNILLEIIVAIPYMSLPCLIVGQKEREHVERWGLAM